MFRRIAIIAAAVSIAPAVVAPASGHAYGRIVMEDVIVSSATGGDSAMLLPAVQAAREAARR